jgi:hypothetical protein
LEKRKEEIPLGNFSALEEIIDFHIPNTEEIADSNDI